MRKLTAALAAMALVVIFGGTAQAAHVFTGPNETATKGATVTFNVDWPHGSITLTCEQGVTQVLNKTQKVTTGFLLDSASWVANTPANCDALWYYIPGAGQPRVTEGERTFVADGDPPPHDAPVVLIVFENRPFSQIAGHAPYLNGLAAQGRLFTHDVAIVHPSLPNYLAFTAGSTLGCATDYNCAPNTRPEENLYHQLEVGGISWNAFAEHMPTNCRLSDSGAVPNSTSPTTTRSSTSRTSTPPASPSRSPTRRSMRRCSRGSRSSRRGTSTTCTTGRSRKATRGLRRTSRRSSMPEPR